MLLNSVVSSGLIILSLLLSFYIIKELAMQVENLIFVINKVHYGNDLTIRASHVCKSEIGQIALALNLMLDKFSGAMHEISASSTTLSTSAQETLQTCEHNFQSMLTQQEEIGLIATAIEELSATIKEVANNTQLNADSAKNTNKQDQNGLNIIQKSYRSIEELAKEIASLATTLPDISTAFKI